MTECGTVAAWAVLAAIASQNTQSGIAPPFDSGKGGGHRRANLSFPVARLPASH
jgi:hypothetical protein